MFAKTQFLENGNQQACWEKVKVVSDVILYTLSLSLFLFLFLFFVALSRTRSSSCTYAWIRQPQESIAINRRVCDDYLTVAYLLPSLVFVFHQNSHEPNRGCSMTVPMKDNVSEGNKERSNCFKNSNYMDYLADIWKCKSVWNCESHFVTEIRRV